MPLGGLNYSVSQVDQEGRSRMEEEGQTSAGLYLRPQLEAVVEGDPSTGLMSSTTDTEASRDCQAILRGMIEECQSHLSKSHYIL